MNVSKRNLSNNEKPHAVVTFHCVPVEAGQN
jgi:hypothetical protein